MASLGELVATMTLNTAQFVGALNKAEQASADTTRAIKKGFESINDSLTGFVAGVFSARAAFEEFNQAVERGAQLKEMAGAFDIAVDKLDQLSLAMQLAGTDAGTFEKQMKTLSNEVTLASNPMSKQAAVFKAMGIEVRDASGEMLSLDQIYTNAIKQLSAIEDPTLRASAAIKLFARGASDALKASGDLDEALAQAQKQIDAYGATSEETAKLSKEFKDNLLLMADGAQRMLLPVIKALTPVFIDLREAFSASNKGSVDLAAAVGTGLATALRTLGAGALVLIGLFKGIGLALGGLAAAFVQLATGNLKGAGAAIDAMNEDLKKNRDATVNSASAMLGLIDVHTEAGKTLERTAVDQTALRNALNNSKDAAKAAAQELANYTKLMGAMELGTAKATDAGASWTAQNEEQVKTLTRIQEEEGKATRFTDEHATSLMRQAAAFDLAKQAQKAFTEDMARMNAEAGRELEQGKRLTAASEAAKKSSDDYVASLNDQIKASNLLVNAMGQTSTQQQIAAANDKIDIELRKQIEKLDEDEKKIRDENRGSIDDEKIAAIEADKARAASAADTAKAIIAANIASQDSFASGWQKAFQSYMDGLTDAKIAQDLFNKLTSGMETLLVGLANHAKDAWSTFKTAALQAIEQVAAKLAVSGILSLIGGGGAIASTGSFASAGSLLSSLTGAGSLGNLSNSLLSGAGEAAAGAAFVGPSATLASGATGLAASLGASAPALAQMLAPVLTAAPYVAAAAAAGYAIFNLIQSKQGGAKVGGFAQTGMDAGRFYTPTQQDASLQTVVDAQAKGYADLVKALGGTAGARFALGYDTDPKGTAGNRVTAGVYVGGQQVYSALNVGAGKDDAALQSELATQAKRMLLAALQASDLPVQVGRLLSSLSAATASSAQIDSILAAAQAVGQMTTALATLGDPLTAAAKALDASSQTALGAWEAQRDALYDLAKAAPNTADGLASVTTATQAFAASTVALLSGIMNAKKALDDMFQTTRDTISAVGKSPDQLYADEQARAATLFQQLQKATDPDQINSLAKQLNDSINKAFGMLSPEDQAANQAAFLAGLDRVQQTTDQQMQAAMDRVAEQSKTDQAFLSSKLDQILAGLSGAVGDFAGAVNTFAGAAGRSSPVVVNNSPADLRGARQTNFA